MINFRIRNCFVSICFILSLIISGISCEFNERTESKNEIPGIEKKEITNEYIIVAKVIDGDTFKMSDGSKVRLIGIDTPEKYDSDKLDRESDMTGRDKETIKKLGEAASEYVRKLVEGKRVTLVRESGYEDKDKYNRLLRYVYLEDGTFVNARIIEDGYANVYNAAQVSKIKEFKRLEREARENKRGLWGEVNGLR